MLLFKKLLAFIVYRTLVATWRIRITEPPEMINRLTNSEPLILGHWHGDELCVAHLTKRYKLAVMTSKSSDGQIMEFVVRRLGGESSKGSSSRGAVEGLKGLIRLMKAGFPGSVAVDGPRGPYHVVKPGIFELSRLTNGPIFPVGIVTSSEYIFHKAWNKARLPYPFAKVEIVFGAGIPAITREQDPRDPKLAELLEKGIVEASQDAGKRIAN